MREDFSHLFFVDKDLKLIRFLRGKYAKDISIRRFYTWVLDYFMRPDLLAYELPIEAFTTHEFVMINGWALSDDVFKALTGGQITQDKDREFAVIVLGGRFDRIKFHRVLVNETFADHLTSGSIKALQSMLINSTENKQTI